MPLTEGSIYGGYGSIKVDRTYLPDSVHHRDYRTVSPFNDEEFLQHAEPVGMWLFAKPRVHQMLKQLRRIDPQYRLGDLLKDLTDVLSSNPTNTDRWDDWGVRSSPFGAYAKAEKLRAIALSRIASRLHNENMYAREARRIVEEPNPVNFRNPLVVRQRLRHNPVLPIPGGYQIPITAMSSRPHNVYDPRVWM